MTKAQAQVRIAKLRSEIERHRYQYHVLDRPEISDAALDSLNHELVRLEGQFPDLVTPDSPTQRVGGSPLPQFKKVAHRQPALSLEDVFAREEVEDWEQRITKLLGRKITNYFCELKLDGLTCVLTYRDGVLAQAATRGDGRIGEDVTHNIRTIESVPLRLRGTKVPALVEVRGEVVMPVAVFEQLNEALAKKGQPQFANPRNAAAGSIRQLDPKVAASRRLDLLAFELLTDMGQTTHQQSHEIMQQLGFKVEQHSAALRSISEVWQFLQAWDSKRKRLRSKLEASGAEHGFTGRECCHTPADRIANRGERQPQASEHHADVLARERGGEHEVAGQQREGRHEIGADHVERAVRQIDQVHDAEDQRQAGRQQEQQQPELQAVQALFQKQQHNSWTREKTRASSTKQQNRTAAASTRCAVLRYG